MKIYKNLFEKIISPENLFSAWDSFKIDKRNKPDVQKFEWNLERNIFQLCRELRNKTYKHGPYTGFYIHDPKQRHIHKASVRDRILHHAVFQILNPIFEETFIPTSFSCRIGYGTHRGVAVLEKMARKIHQNGTSSCFVLKCDIQKFFDSVDHKILLSILQRRIKDENIMRLLGKVIESYAVSTERESRGWPAKGIPIGNLTSQLFANVYMNEFDRFIKHELHIKHYARYTDDFAIVSPDREYLKNLIEPILSFLNDNLALKLHPKKILIRKLSQSIDFLGYVIFPKYRLLRAKTCHRMFVKFAGKVTAYRAGILPEKSLIASLQSYLGVMSHANTKQLAKEMENFIWFTD